MGADPHAVLGVAPGAAPEEVAAAYRALAKRFHPDVARDEAAQERMAKINAAYDALRAEQDAAGEAPPSAPVPRRPPPGAWLPEATRRTLGRELLTALARDEPVVVATRCSTWASPLTVLAVTDRRALWLLDDAISHRVRSLRLPDVREVERRLAWPRRRGTASVRVQATNGRRFAFADLSAEVADELVRALTPAG